MAMPYHSHGMAWLWHHVHNLAKLAPRVLREFNNINLSNKLYHMCDACMECAMPLVGRAFILRVCEPVQISKFAVGIRVRVGHAPGVDTSYS